MDVVKSQETIDVESDQLIEESNSPSKTSSVLILEKETGSDASIIDKYFQDEVPSHGFDEEDSHESRQEEAGAADQPTQTERYSKVPSLNTMERVNDHILGYASEITHKQIIEGLKMIEFMSDSIRRDFESRVDKLVSEMKKKVDDVVSQAKEAEQDMD